MNMNTYVLHAAAGLHCAFQIDSIDEPKVYRVLTNNQDRISCALRWMLKHEDMLDVDVDRKENALARDFISYGNTQHHNHEWQPAWISFTRAIMYAKPNSPDLALAYANRSLALVDLDIFDDCLKDIDRALAIGCPEDLSVKLYIRRVYCLFGIHRKMCPEVKNGITVAEQQINQTPNQFHRAELMGELNEVVKSARTIAPLNVVLEERSFAQVPTDNPQILRASSAIKIQYSDNKYGRHIVAAKDINAGDVLMVDKAFAAVPSYDLITAEVGRFNCNYCWHCSKKAMSSIPCDYCVSVVYCDETCRTNAWEENHKLECGVIRALLDEHPSNAVFLSLRMTVNALYEAGTWQSLNEKLGKIDSLTDPIEKLLEDKVFDSSKYASVYSFVNDTVPVPFTLAIESARVLVFLARFTNVFGKTISKIRNILKHQWTVFAGSVILRNQLISILAVQQKFYPHISKELRIRGHAIMPLWNFFNHSCDANACINSYRDSTAVYALQKIEKGDQIFISYDGLDYFNHDKNVRRRALQEFYNFQCQCRACEKSISVMTIPSFQDLALSNEVKLILSQKASIIQDTKNIKDFNDVLQRLRSLAEALNCFSTFVKRPCKELCILKSSFSDGYHKISR